MEILVEGPFQALLHVLRWLVIQVFCETLCYVVGRFSLYVITMGRYPLHTQTKRHLVPIGLLGFFVLSAICLVLINLGV
mgnify:CR=1 FL=1